MKYIKIFPLLFLLVFVLAFSTNHYSQKRKTTQPPRATAVKSAKAVSAVSPRSLSPDLQRRVDAFNFAWQVIKDNYYDQTFSGLNWDKIQKEYEPRVLRTATDTQLHDILQEMINRLDRSHFAIIPPEVYQAIETAKAEAKAKWKEKERVVEKDEDVEEEADAEDKFDFTDYSAKYGVGVELYLIENQFVVTRVEANSSAAKAGIKTGYILEKINDVSLRELLKQIEIYYAKIRNVKKHLPAEVVEYLLDGAENSFVTLSVTGENGQIKEIKLQRERLKGESVSLGDNYPEQFLKFETAALNDQTGYIKFNAFALPVIEKFCAALTELKDKQAIVIDLRGNTGGIIGSLIGLSGMLTETSIDLGTSIYKIGSENMTALSKAKNYKGRLVFLVDNQTASAAEIFAAGLQENNRALVVGEKTAGEALPSVSVSLPTGAVLLYPIANYKTRSGNFLEGKGVEPNFVVALDRKSLLEGKDVQLETALKLIKENTAFPKSLAEANQKGNVTAPPSPAPKPVALGKGKQLAVVTIKAPPLPPSPPPVYKKDEKALQVIAEFINAIGGEEALNLINSYDLKGSTEIYYRGTKVEGEINILRQKPDRYAEIMRSPSIGKIRQVYNGKKAFVQTEYGLDNEAPLTVKIEEIELFSPIHNLLKKEFFKSLNYLGAFDMLGTKAHVIEAITPGDQTLAFAFNVETKMLVSYTTQQSYVVLFDDYRAVGKVLLPYNINRGSFMKLQLNEIKLNVPIADDNFAESENCYDRVN
jgi:carboxyl-terminal processing protease